MAWRSLGAIFMCRAGAGLDAAAATRPAASSISMPTCGRGTRAAVGQRRVGDGHLQRRGLQVALADGEVDVVAHRPRAVGELCSCRKQAVAPLPAWAGAPLNSPGMSMPVRRPMPSLRAQLLQWVAARPRSGARPWCRRRRRTRPGAPGAARRRRWRRRRSCGRRCSPIFTDPGSSMTVCGRDGPGLERGQRGDELERRAGRVQAGDGAVEQRRAVGRGAAAS